MLYISGASSHIGFVVIHIIILLGGLNFKRAAISPHVVVVAMLMITSTKDLSALANITIVCTNIDYIIWYKLSWILRNR